MFVGGYPIGQDSPYRKNDDTGAALSQLTRLTSYDGTFQVLGRSCSMGGVDMFQAELRVTKSLGGSPQGLSEHFRID